MLIGDFEAGHGQVRWTLRARNATDAIRQRWAGASWIIELISSGLRVRKPFRQQGSLEVKQNSVPDTVLASPAVPEAP